jgi:hypothetical protein
MDFRKLEPRRLARTFLNATIWRLAYRSPWPILIILAALAAWYLMSTPEGG